jgi:hypothetical protein
MSLRIHSLAGGLVMITLLCLTGCQSADEAHTGHMASVEISGFKRSQIEAAAAQVFKANGYAKVDALTFEKPGSGWETANYGGWSSNPVWIRMRCGLVSTDLRAFTLDCDAYVVEGHGEVGTEMERKFWFAKRGDCKALLDQIKAELKSAPAPDDATPQSTP